MIEVVASEEDIAVANRLKPSLLNVKVLLPTLRWADLLEVKHTLRPRF